MKAKIIGASAVIVLLALMLRTEEPSIGDTPPQFMRIEGKLIEFSGERQARHVDTELSFPRHEDVLPGPPLNVVVSFDAPLTLGSAIAARANDTDYGDGDTIIDPTKRTMRRVIKPDAPDGVYAVEYNACFEGGKCRAGIFSFAINRAKAATYDDLRDVSTNVRNDTKIRNDEIGSTKVRNDTKIRKDNEAIIIIESGNFDHARIRIKRGTTVVWKNTDDTPHTIRTEPHPAHTYFEGLASPEFQRGESYSFTFWIPGVYPFHSDTAPEAMAGAIVVE
ncbi:MAG: copper resistance protein CopC [Candidatus Harrisonbacteria bacterium]|nr:copper resistance protein CopC [Candidatus Harrisonbacteria bacterium]